MKNAWALAGWVLAVAAIVAAASGVVWGRQQGRELARVKSEALARVQTLEKQIGELKKCFVSKEEALKSLEGKVAELEAKAASVSAQTDSSGVAPDQAAAAQEQKPAEGVAGMLEKLMGGKKEDKAEEESGNPMAAMANMFKGEHGKEMAKQSASMAVNMQYAELFSSLHLPADVEQQVRDIISESMAGQISSGMEAMQGGGPAEDFKKKHDEAQAKVRADLAKILSPEEMATYDEYETALPKHSLSQSYDMQLGMMAPGMSAESRTRARDVLVEEMLPSIEGQMKGEIPKGDEFATIMAAQKDALGRARERLAQEFDEAQMGQVDRFVQQMQQTMEMSSRMMQGMMPGKEKPKGQ